MRKEEVFVRVSSEKKARKLKELLEMFNQKTFSPESIDEAFENNWIIEFDSEELLWLNSYDSEDKTKVSLKELRNILAKDKLREGDVIVANNEKYSFVGVFSCIKDGLFFVSNWRYLGKDEFFSNESNDNGYLHNFIRYATEEEKASLEPNKELEVGKWYWCNLDNEIKTLFCFNGSYGQYTQYGFNADKKWSNQLGCIHGLSFTEATPQEVEQALIKEAKRRYSVGDVIDQSEIYTPVVRKKTIIGIEEFRFGHINKDSIEVLTGICAETVFKNGKWAEVVKHEKSLEERVKELEDVVGLLSERTKLR